MMRLTLLIILTCCYLSAQLGTEDFRRGLEDATFANCRDVLDRAISFAAGIRHRPSGAATSHGSGRSRSPLRMHRPPAA